MRAVMMTVNHDWEKIGNDIMPEKVEQPYLTLMNHIADLKEALLNQKYYDKMSNKSTRKINENMVNPENINNVLNQIIAIAQSGITSITDAKELLKLAEENLQLAIQHEKTEKEYEELLSYDAEATESQKNSRIAVKQIIADLQAIKELDNGINLPEGKRRLDGIVMNERHTRQIEALPNINEENKQALSDILKAYVELEVELFKCLEAYAQEIIIKDQEGTLKVDDFDLELNSSKFRWIIGNFVDIENDIFVAINVLSTNYAPKDNIADLIAVMTELKKFLQTGKLDKERLHEIAEKEHLYNYFSRTENVLIRMQNYSNYLSKTEQTESIGQSKR